MKVPKKLKSFIDESIKNASKKQKKFIKKFNIKKTTKYLLNKDGNMKAFNNKKLLFSGKYEVIGTYNYKTNFYRHSSNNKLIPKNLSNLSNKLKKYNKQYNTYIFSNEMLEGHDWGKIFTSISVEMFDGIGYLVKNDHDEYPEAYLVIKEIN
tara:strand:- start:158 stop:613 length:456 start_codon:yes stop_codon:yes gene_type:complete